MAIVISYHELSIELSVGYVDSTISVISSTNVVVKPRPIKQKTVSKLTTLLLNPAYVCVCVCHIHPPADFELVWNGLKWFEMVWNGWNCGRFSLRELQVYIDDDHSGIDLIFTSYNAPDRLIYFEKIPCDDVRKLLLC